MCAIAWGDAMNGKERKCLEELLPKGCDGPAGPAIEENVGMLANIKGVGEHSAKEILFALWLLIENENGWPLVG